MAHISSLALAVFRRIPPKWQEAGVDALATAHDRWKQVRLWVVALCTLHSDLFGYAFRPIPVTSAESVSIVGGAPAHWRLMAFFWRNYGSEASWSRLERHLQEAGLEPARPFYVDCCKATPRSVQTFRVHVHPKKKEFRVVYRAPPTDGGGRAWVAEHVRAYFDCEAGIDFALQGMEKKAGAGPPLE